MRARADQLAYRAIAAIVCGYLARGIRRRRFVPRSVRGYYFYMKNYCELAGSYMSIAGTIDPRWTAGGLAFRTRNSFVLRADDGPALGMNPPWGGK
jgi:hypothetical protein